MTYRVSPLLIAALGVALGSTMDALIKLVAEDVPIFQAVAWRYIIGAGITVALMAIRRRPLPSWEGFRFHLLRGVITGACGVCFFFTLTQIALSEATVLIFAAALMIAPVARFMLNEKISKFTMGATMLGFLGIGLATMTGVTEGAPPDGNRLLGLTTGLASAVFYAIGVVMLRMRAGVEDSITMVAFSNTVPAIALLPFAFQISPSHVHGHMPLIAIAGILGVLVWWLIATAYGRAPAQKLAPLEYTAMIWATLLGWLLFQERPHSMLYLGSVVVILACLAVAFESRFVTRREAKQPASDIPH